MAVNDSLAKGSGFDFSAKQSNIATYEGLKHTYLLYNVIIIYICLYTNCNLLL